MSDEKLLENAQELLNEAEEVIEDTLPVPSDEMNGIFGQPPMMVGAVVGVCACVGLELVSKKGSVAGALAGGLVGGTLTYAAKDALQKNPKEQGLVSGVLVGLVSYRMSKFAARGVSDYFTDE